MTPELRLDRAERLLVLIVKAGYRARQQSRAQDEKINILIDSQMKTDEQIKGLRAAQARTDKVMAELAEEHKATERSLRGLERSVRAFIDGLQKGHNGKP